MAKYYFIKSGGYLFRLTKKAYRAWIVDSANRLEHKRNRAKISNYGINVGEIADIKAANDFEFSDFEHFKKMYSVVENELD